MAIAWDSAGTPLTATSAGTKLPVRPAILAVGDLMVVEITMFTADATTITHTMHASMSGDGWAEVPGSPFAWITADDETALFWKIADASDVAAQGTAIPGGITVSHNGSTTGDYLMARIHRFTSTDGFAATPFESVSSSNGNSPDPVSMNTVTPGGTGRLGVSLILFRIDHQAPTSATGETGSDWTEVDDLDSPGGFEVESQVQTCDLSGGGAVSGGSTTHATSSGWLNMSWALAPGAAGPTYAQTKFRLYSDTGAGLGESQ